MDLPLPRFFVIDILSSSELNSVTAEKRRAGVSALASERKLATIFANKLWMSEPFLRKIAASSWGSSRKIVLCF